MALEVIGVGFGRTGTTSLRMALEELGFGPCYNMAELGRRAEHASTWISASNGRTTDWNALFNGYKSAVGWPVAAFWQTLAVEYPQAKILLSVRESHSWYLSVRNTIYENLIGNRPTSPGPLAIYDVGRSVVLERTFQGEFEHEASAIDIYRRHIVRVRAELSSERLLEFDAGAGWVPLCKFLGVEVPMISFPQANTREEFPRFDQGQADA